MEYFFVLLFGGFFGACTLPIVKWLGVKIEFVKNRKLRIFLALVGTILVTIFYVLVNAAIGFLVADLLSLEEPIEGAFQLSIIAFLITGALVNKFLATPWLKKQYPKTTLC